MNGRKAINEVGKKGSSDYPNGKEHSGTRLPNKDPGEEKSKRSSTLKNNLN